jgi:hypothetical protein
LSERAVAITQALMLRNPQGPLFGNCHGEPWTTDAVGCAFDRLTIRMGAAELARMGEQISAADIAKCIQTLAKHCVA